MISRMESGSYSDWKDSSSLDGSENNMEEDDGFRFPRTERFLSSFPSFSVIPQPQTPKEPMEFLSRSWSLSAAEIAKALAHRQRQPSCVDRNAPNVLLPDTVAESQLPGKVINSRRSGALSKWFHHKDHNNSSSTNTVKKKDKARLENAHIHSAISIAALATGLASVTAAARCSGSPSKMSIALASATELLASHCAELAETAGADRTSVASVVRSAVGIHSPGDLMTLTAAAATALRGEAALKGRLSKEAKKNAAISPCERSFVDFHWSANFHHESIPPLEGELMQCTRNGVLRCKRVTVYINKKSQVVIKLKSKHVGGTFSKKNKSVVYGVCDETAAWPYRRERESSEEVYFGLKTGQGLLEFKCKSKVHKQRWVDGIQNLLRQVTWLEAAKCSLESLSLSNHM